MVRSSLTFRLRAAVERYLWRVLHPVGFLRSAAPIVLSPRARWRLLRLLGRGDARRRPPADELASTCERWLGELRAIAPSPHDPRPADEGCSQGDGPPLASVLVVSHHNPEATLLCLESLRRFTTYPRWEVVVVDNDSDTATHELLRRAAASQLNMRLQLNGHNVGFATACNQAAELATGSVLCLLNNDTVVTPGWLDVLVRAVLADERVGMVGPTSGGVANEARVATPYTDVAGLLSWAAKQRRDHADRSFSIGMLAMFCTVLRRAVWNDVGPLDEKFGIGLFEDTDYSRRLRRAGYDLRCLRGAYVHHWQQAAFGRVDDDRYHELYERNWLYYKTKWSRPD